MTKTLREIFSILTQKEQRKFIGLAILDTLVSLLDIGFLVLLLLVLNFYTQREHTEQPSLFYFSAFAHHSILPILLFFVLFSIKNFFGHFVFKKQFNYVYDVASRISEKRLLNYLEGNYGDYVNINSAVYARKIGQEPIEFSHYVLRGLQQVISQSLLIILTIIPVMTFNPVLFPLLLVILVPPVILLAYLMKKKLNRIRVTGKLTGESSMQYLQEALAGFIESNVYEKNEFFTARYCKSQSAFNRFLSQQQVIQNMPSRLIEVFAIFGLLLLVAINSLTSSSETISFLTLGAFVAAAYKIIPGIVKILNSMGHIKTYSYTLTGLNKKESTGRAIGTDPKIASIEFNQVDFSHDNTILLKKCSFRISKGSFIGIAVDSGKGKTSLVNLLLGFLDPAAGSISINEAVTSANARQQYWSRISYVKQQSFLIHASIRENITLSEDTYDAERLALVMRLTGIDGLLKMHPEGIQTMITEEGKNFSGGQRQRIILARALYKDFDLLVLDEPFNELDEAAEKDLLQYLKNCSESGKIIILITHNKEGLSFCDQKILLT